jgi:hypothetical protein
MSGKNQTVRIGRMNIVAEGADAPEAKRFARRVAELLGESLAGGPAIRPSRQAIVDLAVPPGLSGEYLAQFVAREIRRRLG